jgi:hypothetical protein
VKNDPTNCGACGVACPAGQLCSGGACGLTCLGGSSLCNGKCVDLQDDPANCGKCATTCAGAANATGVCVKGACAGPLCNAGYGDCDANAANGCEATLLTDVKNCGKCGNACAAGQVCSAGACVAGGYCPPKAFPTGGLPATLTGSTSNSFGSFTFDGAGNLLAVVGGPSGYLYSVSVANDAVSQIATLRANIYWTSVAFDPVKNVAYLGGAGGEIDAYDMVAKTLVTLGTTSGQSINSMVLAPASFLAAPNQLVLATYGGGVIAFDPVTKAQKTLVPNATTGPCSGIAVTSKGTVYVSAYNNKTLYAIAPGGASSVLATFPGQCDGLAVDEVRARVYAADSDLQKVHIVAMANGAVTDVAGSYAFDGGYWPTPIAYDCSGTLLVAINPGAPTKVSSIALP